MSGHTSFWWEVCYHLEWLGGHALSVIETQSTIVSSHLSQGLRVSATTSQPLLGTIYHEQLCIYINAYRMHLSVLLMWLTCCASNSSMWIRHAQVICSYCTLHSSSQSLCLYFCVSTMFSAGCTYPHCRAGCTRRAWVGCPLSQQWHFRCWTRGWSY